jgi:hypothetical protein
VYTTCQGGPDNMDNSTVVGWGLEGAETEREPNRI